MFVRVCAWLFFAVITTVPMTLGSRAEVAAGGGCRHMPSTEGMGATVEMREICFQPTVLHVETGQAVTWTNLSEVVHSVASATLEWGNYTTFGQGQSVSYTFAKPGTYPYYCFEHNGMIGAIVVGDGRGTGAAAAVRAAASVPEPASPAATEPSLSVATVAPPTGESDVGWLPLGIVGFLGIVIGGGGGMALVRARR